MATDSKDESPSPYDTYQTSLTTRYCSPEMSRLYSQRPRRSQWRKLWFLLAESQRELGINTISTEALEQMRQHIEVTDADFEVARAEEKICRYDVMAHVHAFGAVATAAAGIIHYGATSCFVTDNTELILMRDAMDLLLPRLANVISNLNKLAMDWKETPTLARTHGQPSQPITVGKRAAGWAQDLVFDLEEIEHCRDKLRLRGAQGTTGTQASFLEIFGGDGSKCDQLNGLLCSKTGFPGCYDVVTQTYSRKVDVQVTDAICGLATSAQKIGMDIRHLAGWQEAEETFEAGQVGSSAMAFKRNPMLSERICSLGRELYPKQSNTAATRAAQWMERSLDDSAIRRMDIAEMFLLADAIIGSLDNVANGIQFYTELIASSLRQHLTFMCTENIIMKVCAKGVSRQEAHEQIRVLSHQAAEGVKKGKLNDLIDRIKATEFFRPIWAELDGMLRPELYTGRSVVVAERYCGPGGVADEKIRPYRASFSQTTAELNV